MRHIWAFFADTQYPRSPTVFNKASVPARQVSSVSAAIKRSCTYCRSESCGFCHRYSPRFSCSASSKIVGEFLYPWGNLVQVSCPLNPSSGSLHLKAKMAWLAFAKGRLKKASLRSNTVYQTFVGASELSRVYGLGTVGCISATHRLTSRKSWIGL